MASASRERPDAGYATATAAVVSAVIAIGAVAVLSMNFAQLRNSRANLQRAQLAARLEGAQLLAAYAITTNSSPGRLRWSTQALDTHFEILAEPEAEKLNAKISAEDSPEALRGLGATDAREVAAWILDQGRQASPQVLTQADVALPWRQCAASSLSYYGRGRAYVPTAPHVPDGVGQRSHVGEVWRVLVDADGWVEERLVRVTGNSQQPAITIERDLRRSNGLPQCPQREPPNEAP